MHTPEEALRRWDALMTYVRGHWLNPDPIPLRVALAQYAIHWQLDNPPVWSFVLGPPGSAKSSMVIQALKFLPGVFPMDIINKNSFVSGWGKDFGLLPQLPLSSDGSGRRSGVIVFSDFSTFLEMDKNERKFIQAQLRVIYDGSCGKTPGNQKIDGMPAWVGKATIIAACTTALESHWTLARELGERFIFCRMEGREEPVQESISRQSMGQLNNGNYKSRAAFENLVKNFVDPEGLTFGVYIGMIEESLVPETAMLIARARGKVMREGKKVVDVSEIEYPTRLTQELALVAAGNAALMRRVECSTADYKLARKIGIDTIPRNRYIVLRDLWIRYQQGMTMDTAYNLSKSHKSYSPYEYALEDLEALSLIETAGEPTMVRLSDKGVRLLTRCQFDPDIR